MVVQWIRQRSETLPCTMSPQKHRACTSNYTDHLARVSYLCDAHRICVRQVTYFLSENNSCQCKPASTSANNRPYYFVEGHRAAGEISRLST